MAPGNLSVFTYACRSKEIHCTVPVPMKHPVLEHSIVSKS